MFATSSTRCTAISVCETMLCYSKTTLEQGRHYLMHRMLPSSRLIKEY